MTLLTPSQIALLDQIEATRAEEKQTIDAIEAHLKMLKAGAGYPKTYALVRQARDAGIPVTRIGKAYGTKDAYTIKRILAADVATPGQMIDAYTALAPTPTTTSAQTTATSTPTPTESTVFVEEMSYSDPDFPHFLGENHPVSKIQVACLQVTPSSKIGRVSAVVDLKAKICVESDSTDLTRLIDGPRENYPQPLEDALGPLLDKVGGLY